MEEEANDAGSDLLIEQEVPFDGLEHNPLCLRARMLVESDLKSLFAAIFTITEGREEEKGREKNDEEEERERRGSVEVPHCVGGGFGGVAPP